MGGWEQGRGEGVPIAAVELTAPAVAPGLIPRGRCSFYLYDAATDEFRREDYYPHHRVPRNVIDPVGTTHMKTQILGGGGKTFRIDGVVERHSYLIPPGSGYKAVIAVPVIFGTKEVGVLAVDAPEYSDFNNDHVTLMESLAAVLATAYALS
ncbi:GAF domain-containing protein [Streptomyces sp. UH6]|uniref:GAF domain-containing protein n=1 Tax=Streptomyces sp. UH6 TaxID=2748379 RepID=UPI0035BC65C4